MKKTFTVACRGVVPGGAGDAKAPPDFGRSVNPMSIRGTDYAHILTGKSLSEALILASTNPQYDKRLFIDLALQYMKTTSSEHVVYINCSECQNKNKKQFV